MKSMKTNPFIIDQELKINQGEINFENVNFKYDTKEDPALNLINLKIKGGKMTSLVGYSGAGKSTILNLIPRFYDCQSGDILIDNQSIYKSKLSSLRKKYFTCNSRCYTF